MTVRPQKGYGRASTTHTAFYPVRPTYLLGHEAKGNEVNLTSTQIALARLSTLSRWVSQVTSHTQYARNTAVEYHIGKIGQRLGVT